MKRLQTDFIDIYQLHSSKHDVEDAKKVKIILEDLVDEGKIGGYGWSTDDPERMKVFAESKNCNSVQYAMNITLHNKQMIQLCERYNLVGLIRSPLASGILTGKYKEQIKIADDHMLANVDFSQERYKIINQKLPKIEEILEEEGRTLVQGLLGYLMATSKTTIPIPGAKTVEQIEENANSLDFGPLSHDNVRQIDDLLSDLDDK
jgi:aryl-alcohol dehydrogenase-like predicted oxidoreductase